jgi:hypothetical protein
MGDAKVLHVPTSCQFADIFTKGLPSVVFTEFRSSLNILLNEVQSVGGVEVYPLYIVTLHCN